MTHCVKLLGVYILVMDVTVASLRPNDQHDEVLDVFINKIDGMQVKLDRLETSENAMKRRVAELETEREIDKQANALLINKIDDKLAKLDRQETSETALKQTLAGLQTEVDRQEDALAMLVNDNARMETSGNSMKERIVELENKLQIFATKDEIISKVEDKENVPEDENQNSDVEPKMTVQKKSQMRLSPHQNVEQVAFTAYLDHVIRNIGIDQPIVYNIILLNDGHGYSVNTGIFRVPTTGVYLFSWSVTARKLAGEHLYDVWVRLVVNGIHQVGAIAESQTDYNDNQGSNSAVIRCNQGDEVWIQHYHGADLFGADTERTTSFMGILMYMTE